MWGLSAITILVILCSGCSFHIDEYKRLRDVDIVIGGNINCEKAERSAKNFEEQWNKQFDCNVKMPRSLFNLGTYVDSVTNRDGIKIIEIEGKF